MRPSPIRRAASGECLARRYYQQIRGYAALAAGLLMAPRSLGTMIALPVAGKPTDRLGARPVVLTGIGVSALVALFSTQVGATTPLPVLAAKLARQAERV